MKNATESKEPAAATEGPFPCPRRPERWTRGVVRRTSVARDLVQTRGAAAFVFRILPWTARRRYLVFEGSLSEGVTKFRADIPLRIGPAGPSDLDLLFRIRPGYYDRNVVGERLEHGHLCFMAWEGERPVHVHWAFTGSVWLPYLDRTLVLPPGEVYYDEAFTVPDRRRRGVDHETLGEMLGWFAERGYTKHAFLSPTWDEPLHRRAAGFRMMMTGAIGPSRILKRRLVVEGRAKDLGMGCVTLG